MRTFLTTLTTLISDWLGVCETILFIALVLVALLSVARGDEPGPPRLLQLWPKAVKVPAGLVPYVATRHNQNSANTNGAPSLTPQRTDRDDPLFGLNPNRVFPYATPGGLHHASDWESELAVALPAGQSITTWTEYRQSVFPRPVRRWSFPEGTAFFDLLVRKSTGEPFELRRLRKDAGGWVAHTLWETDAKPPGYRRTDRTCLQCHSDAGNADRYAVTTRGADSVFSFPFFVEGAVEPDWNRWPIRQR